MKKNALTILFGFICVVSIFTAQAYEPDQKVYTKKTDTPLLSEPRPLADQVGKIAWGTAVTIKEVQGRWLRVSNEGKSGWVFSGNVSESRPPAENKNDFLPTTASETTAATAARPLSESSKKFAQRRNLDDSIDDIRWLEKHADKITTEDVKSYMKQNKLGEYAE